MKNPNSLILLLEYLSRYINRIESTKELYDVQFLEEALLFLKTEESMFYEAIIKSNEDFRVFYAKEIDRHLTNLRELEQRKSRLFEAFDIDFQIDRWLRLYENRIDRELKRIKPIRKKYNEANNSYDSGAYRYDSSSPEFIRLGREFEMAKRDYKANQKKLEEAYTRKKDRLEEVSKFFEIDFKKMFNKAENIHEIVQPFIGSPSNKNPSFKSKNSLTKAYNIFVGQKLVEEIQFIDFINQIDDQNSVLTFQKQTGAKTYLSYAINKLREHIEDGKKNAWENRMLKHFDIERVFYDKKKNPSQENKTKRHKKIDRELQ